MIPFRQRTNRGWLLGAIAALCLILAGCSSSQADSKSSAQSPAPNVEVTKVELGDADIYADFPAQTYARNMVEIRGRVDGYIEKWLFRPGQEVQAGQALYVLDLRPYQAQVSQAQGTLRQTEADLSFAQRQVSRLEAEANLATAQSNLVKAQQDYNRLKPLVEQDAAARQDLEAAVAALRAAEATVRSNQANVEQTRLTTETQVQSTEGKVQAQRAAVETATLNLQYGTIRAPIGGLIGDTQIPVGGLVTANSAQPLTTIVPLNPIWVRFKVSEAQYLAFMRQTGGPTKDSPKLQLILADSSQFPHAGRVTNALNQVDPRTGTLEMQAEFPNPEHRLLPGQFGRIHYVAEHRTGVILVPQRAVQQTQSLQTVYTVGAGNKIEARVVKTGDRVGDAWLIEQGLRPGDRVVVEGLLTSRPGMVVTPEPYKEKPAAAAARKAG
jgi:membrane fusion protein (multidrug efflux system)